MSIPLDGPVMETMSLTQRSLVVIPLHLLQLAPDVYSIVTYLKIKKFASEQETTGVHIERSIPNDIVNGFLSVFHFWALIRAAKMPFLGTSLDFAAFFGQRKIMTQKVPQRQRKRQRKRWRKKVAKKRRKI